MNAEATLQSLLKRVETQLGFEYHEPERVEYELENMTVRRLLEMLAYMMDAEPEMTDEDYTVIYGWGGQDA